MTDLLNKIVRMSGQNHVGLGALNLVRDTAEPDLSRLLSLYLDGAEAECANFRAMLASEKKSETTP